VALTPVATIIFVTVEKWQLQGRAQVGVAAGGERNVNARAEGMLIGLWLLAFACRSGRLSRLVRYLHCRRWSPALWRCGMRR